MMLSSYPSLMPKLYSFFLSVSLIFSSAFSSVSKAQIPSSVPSADPQISPTAPLANPRIFLPDHVDSSWQGNGNDAETAFTQSCRPGQALGNNEFVYVGRGGLPPTPTSLRSIPGVWHDIRFPAESKQSRTPSIFSQPTTEPQSAPVEAKSWSMTSTGIMLTAPQNISMTVAFQPPSTC